MSTTTKINKRSPKWYGWLPDLPDHRDLLYSAIAPKVARLPKKIDLQAKCSPVPIRFWLYRLRIFRVQSGREIRRVEYAEAKGESRWGHAVMAAGYKDREKRFLIRNSWGSDWGRKGYFTMPFAYLADRTLSDDFWTIRASEEG
jgi:hypothetical protein